MRKQKATVPNFWVADIPVFGDLILSPMAGYSDLPFRSLCRELGSAMSYTEFIGAIEVLQNFERIKPHLAFYEWERPVVFQLFDNDPQSLLEAALRLQEFSPDVIDINMGCSARRVSGRGAGAGLLRTPEKVAQIFKLLSGALEVPVTAKIRLGWDDEQRTYPTIARVVEENGGALIAVHGRTKAQEFRGMADWDAIAQVKEVVSIPVIANGDVNSVEDITHIKAHTGCEGVMIGRAAMGNPWIFSRIDRAQISTTLLLTMVRRHLARALEFYGEERGLLLFRKHASRYLRPLGLVRQQREFLFSASTSEEFLNRLVEITPA